MNGAIRQIKFLLAFHINDSAILCRLRDIATYCSKFAIFYTPPVVTATAGDPVGILRRCLILIKLKWSGYMWWRNYGNTLSHHTDALYWRILSVRPSVKLVNFSQTYARKQKWVLYSEHKYLAFRLLGMPGIRDCVNSDVQHFDRPALNLAKRAACMSWQHQLGTIRHPTTCDMTALTAMNALLFVNPLKGRGNYIATSNNMKLVHSLHRPLMLGCYIWYSDEGTGRGPSPPRPLIAVPNVTAHPSTASVPTSFYSMCQYNCLYPLKD